MDWNYIQAELKEINLREFAGNILGLCEVWFGNAQSNTLYEEMAEYVFSSGTDGTRKHAVISSLGIRAGKKHLSPKYVCWQELFFPTEERLQNFLPLQSVR